MRGSARNGASASGVPSVLALSTTSTSQGLPLASSQPRTAVSGRGKRQLLVVRRNHDRHPRLHGGTVSTGPSLCIIRAACTTPSTWSSCAAVAGRVCRSTRQSIPKPLVEIGGEPILWHVIQIYAAQGFRRFTLATGYKGEQIEAFVTGHTWPEGVEVRCLDTGPDTPTGGRIHQAGDALGGRPFCATYGDGVADVDLGRLLGFHRDHGGLATMTVVRPELQFGVAELDDDGRVRGFREKPRLEHWINGGFFCFEPGALEYVGPDERPRARAARGPRRGRGSSAPTATRASGSAWTRTRTRCCSTTRGPGTRPLEAVGLMRSAFVTGAYGLLGTAIVRALLDEGVDVTVLRRDVRPRSPLVLEGLEDRVDVVAGDITDLPLVDRTLGEYEVDTVFHLAAQTIVGTAQRSPLGDLGGEHPRDLDMVLEACRQHEVARVVVAASDKAYGAHDELPYREEHGAAAAAIPTTSSKAATDLIARSYWHTYGLPVAMTRFANLYGGGTSTARGWCRRPSSRRCAAARRSSAPTGRPSATSSTSTTRRPPTSRWRARSTTRTAAPAARRSTPAAGSRMPCAMSSALICSLAGTDVRPDIRGQGTPRGEIDRQYVDTSKLRERTGWVPRVGLEEGLRRTIDWYRDHPGALDA